MINFGLRDPDQVHVSSGLMCNKLCMVRLLISKEYACVNEHGLESASFIYLSVEANTIEVLRGCRKNRKFYKCTTSTV